MLWVVLIVRHEIHLYIVKTPLSRRKVLLPCMKLRRACSMFLPVAKWKETMGMWKVLEGCRAEGGPGMIRQKGLELVREGLRRLWMAVPFVLEEERMLCEGLEL